MRNRRIRVSSSVPNADKVASAVFKLLADFFSNLHKGQLILSKFSGSANTAHALN